ncbi:MAG: tetratricopeptide repeat protein [Lentisphaeria bacterium]|nr:tetratricopeptide repeat protein [Lentisphaeria bacterium]
MKKWSKTIGILLSLCAFCSALKSAPTPWDEWRSGYINCEKGEEQFERGNYTASLAFFERAKKSYYAVRSARPDWNQRVIAERIAECDRKIKELRALLTNSRSNLPGKTAPSTAGKPARTPGKPTASGSGKTSVPQTSVNTTGSDGSDLTVASENDSAAMLELRSTLKRVRTALEQSRKDTIILRTKFLEIQGELVALKKNSGSHRNFEQEIAKLVRDRRIAQEKYDLLAARCKSLEAEISKPNSHINTLNARLLEERANYDREVKRVSELEERLKSEETQARENRLARSAAEKVIIQLKETQSGLNSEIQLLKQRLQESLNRNQEIADELERNKNHNAELSDVIRKGASGQISGDASSAALAADLRKTIAERDSRIAAFERKIPMLNENIAALKLQLKEERAQIEEMKKEFDRGRAALDKSISEAETLRKQNTVLSAEVKQLASRNSELDKRLETRDSEDFRNAAAARETCRKLEKDILTLQSELVSVRASANSSNAKIDDLERKLKSASAELQNTRNREIALAAVKEQQSVELARLNQAAAEFAELKRNFEALASENRENRAMLAAAKPKEQELARVKLRLLELDRLKAALAQEQQLNEELRNETTRLNAEVKNLRSRSSELDDARRKMAEFQGVVKELAELKRVQKEYSGHISNIEPELAKLKIRTGELETLLKERQAQFEQLARQHKNLNDVHTARERELASLQNVKKRNYELDSLILSQTREIDRLNAIFKRFESGEKSALFDEYRRQIEDLRRSAGELAPLNDQLTRLKNQHEEMKQQFLDRIARLNTRCEAAEAFSERRKQELEQLRKLNSELVTMRNSSGNALKDKADQAQLNRLNEEIAALNKLYSEVTAERDRLNSELDAMRRGISPETVQIQVAQSPEELAGAGLAAERNGNIQLAIWNYKQALLADGNFRSAHLRLGHLLYAQKDYAGALPHLSSARTVEKFNLDLSIKTARCQIELKRYGNAKNIVDTLLKKHSNDYRVQLLAGLIESGSGSASAAEERLITASRLAPGKPEVCIELARLLANSITDRKGEAVKYYEMARALGAAPVPELEKKLSALLDNRREMIRFLSGAAAEAELSRDYGSAVWYYRKLVDIKPEEFIPRLALALHRDSRSAAARETLEFNKPTRLGMAVLTIIELDSKNESAALHAARQASGAKLPEDWQAMTMEIAKWKAMKVAPAAISILLSGLQK